MLLLKKGLSLFKNIHFQSLLGNGVMAIFGMLSVAILYRALSVNEVGIYVFFMTVITLIDTIKSGFLTNSFLKFYAGTQKERADEVVGSAWVLGMYITGFFVLCNLLLLPFLPIIKNQGTLLFLKYFSVISVSTFPAFIANLIVQGEKRFDRLLYMRLINQVVFLSTIIILIILKKASLASIILSYIFSNSVASIATILLGWTKIGAIRYFSKKAILELFHFGKFSMATSLSANLFSVTDIFFINIFLGPAALAMYNLGNKLIQVIEIPLLSFAASGMPSLSSHFNNNQTDLMMYTMKKISGMLSIGIFAIALFSLFFADIIIGIVGGGKYMHTDAPNLFRIMISIAILTPPDRFFSLTLDVIHKPQVNFYKILLMLAVNLIADFIGVAVFKSVYGIVVANLFPTLCAIIISYHTLNKYFKFHLWDIYKIGYNEIIIAIRQNLAYLKI